MRLLSNWVALRMFPGDAVSEGGIIMPDSFKKESEKGEVVLCGAGTSKLPMKFNPGDIVHRVKGHGIPVEHEGELLYFMDQKTILAYA